MASDLATSRQLRDDLQLLTERAAALVGSDHPAVATLMKAADQLATGGPRRYGELPDRE